MGLDLAEEHFPGGQIVDLYHARQRLWKSARRPHPDDEAGQKAWIRIHQRRLLDKGRSKTLVSRFDPSSTNPKWSKSPD